MASIFIVAVLQTAVVFVAGMTSGVGGSLLVAGVFFLFNLLNVYARRRAR